jgi:hypothetical protein
MSCGPQTAREDQIVSFILAFLTGMWPARHLKKEQCGPRTKIVARPRPKLR